MQYRYALAEGAMFRAIHWKEVGGDSRDFDNELQLFKHAESEGWELVQVVPSGHENHFRNWYFRSNPT